MPESRPPKGPRTLAWAMGTTIVSLVAALIVTGFIVWPQLHWERSEYGYDIVETTTVPADLPWTFRLPFLASPDPMNRDEPWADIIRIYADPALTNPVLLATSTNGWTLTGRYITFEPLTIAARVSDNLPTTLTDAHLGNAQAWPAGTYYIVQNRNLLNQPLATPRVHVYTVAPADGPAATPAPRLDVTDQGIPRLTWAAVPGAAAYHILKLPPAGVIDFSGAVVIGIADGDATSWLASGQDRAYQNALQTRQDVDAYNRDFQAYGPSGDVCNPQDATYQGMAPPKWDTTGFTYPQYAVVAVDADGNTSLPVPLDGKSVIPSVPLATATATLRKLGESAGQVFVPESYPVTMGDCHTAFFPVTPLALTGIGDRRGLQLTYGVAGTELRRTITAATRGSAYNKLAALGRQYHLREALQAGVMGELNVMTASQLSHFAVGRTPSDEVGESSYSWNGTSEMVKFIAAALFAGVEAIDMSRFTADPAAPLIYDALGEALLQNPYITDTFPVIGIRDNTLYVNYEMTPEDRAASAERIEAAVDKVVAKVITPGMNDRQKALAINNYLAKNAVYDTAALEFSQTGARSREEYVHNFPYAWDPEGVLLKGRGVCSSYAGAFKLIADKVGVNSVAVTGYADDSGIMHEWIKADLDGKWRIIDPTWDSNIWEQVRGNTETYFGLKDSQTDRRQTNYFVVDKYQWDYDAK